MKTGLVLEGGGLRGIFTAGVLDCFQEEKIEFDYVIGVSAGAGNALNFISRQIGRSRKVINRPKDNTYYGPKEILFSHKIINLDKVFGSYIYEVDPFQFDTYFANKTEVEYVVTNCQTGEEEFLHENHNRERLCLIGKASCSIPVICPPVKIDGNYYLDGSIANSIPYERAFEKGCDKLIVVSTKGDGMNPSNFGKYKLIMHRVYDKSFEPVIEACEKRLDVYYEQAEYCNKLEEEGKMLIIRPEDGVVKIGHMETDNEKLDKMYLNGYCKTKEKMKQIRRFLEED